MLKPPETVELNSQTIIHKMSPINNSVFVVFFLFIGLLKQSMPRILHWLKKFIILEKKKKSLENNI